VAVSNRVLVIDNTILPATSSQLLTKEGYEVEKVHDSDVGLQQLDTQAYDIIIVQENHETESWQLCEKIRHLSRTPLIVISINASADTCVKAINAGADYFMRKPFGPLEFLARVQSLLQRTSLNQSAPVHS
jgi:two-component system response regulator VanR